MQDMTARNQVVGSRRRLALFLLFWQSSCSQGMKSCQGQNKKKKERKVWAKKQVHNRFSPGTTSKKILVGPL